MKHRKIRKYKKVFGVPDFSQLGLRYMVIKFYFIAEVYKFRMSKTVCNNRILFGFVILSDEGPIGSDFRKCLIERCDILDVGWTAKTTDDHFTRKNKLTPTLKAVHHVLNDF